MLIYTINLANCGEISKHRNHIESRLKLLGSRGCIQLVLTSTLVSGLNGGSSVWAAKLRSIVWSYGIYTPSMPVELHLFGRSNTDARCICNAYTDEFWRNWLVSSNRATEENMKIPPGIDRWTKVSGSELQKHDLLLLLFFKRQLCLTLFIVRVIRGIAERIPAKTFLNSPFPSSILEIPN